MLWLGCGGSPATKRSLPSLSAFQAVIGLVFGMVHIVPCPGRGIAMSISATELIDWFDREHRDLPWRHPEVGAWKILVSEYMLQQTPVARVLPIWLDWVARWPT